MPSFTVTYPFDISLSKNKMWGISRAGIRYLACRDALNQLSLVLANAKALKRAVFKPNAKVHVALTVYKPNNRSDAQNFLDVILDAVSTVIGVDDRWFEGSWEWHIDAKNPRFIIGVSQ